MADCAMDLKYQPLNNLPSETKRLVISWMLEMAELFIEEYKNTRPEDRKSFDVQEYWLTLREELE